MNFKLTLALALAFALVLLGCQGGTPATGDGPVGSPPAKQASPPAVPLDLQTEAYHWYGLANEKPISFDVSVKDSVSYHGTQTVHLKSTENGKAVYEIERTGGLGDQLGTDTVSLEKKGIFVTQSTMYTSDAPNLDMPANVAVGAKWPNKGKLTMKTGQHFEQDMNFEVIGERQVTTKVGAQTALLIVATGNLKIDQAKYRMESSQWYVKDKGLVKSEIKMLALGNPKAKPQVITIQETKP